MNTAIQTSKTLSLLLLGMLASLFLNPASVFAAEEKLAPAVEAFFKSDNEFIQKTILPNIEKHRKGDARLRIFSPEGKPIGAQKISVKLRRHKFHFGCAPRAELSKDGPYRKAWSDIWEYAVPENSQKWYRIEPTEGKLNYRVSDAIVDFLKANDYAVEYHFLAGYHPKWIAEKSDEDKARLQKAHMLRTVKRYHKRIDYFQVYNEFWRLPVSKAKAFVEPKAFFEQLVKEYPNVKFGVSDCWRLNERLPKPDEISQRFPGVDYIALHAHAPRRLWVEPKVIYQCFEPYRNSKIKLHVTEFGIREGIISRADTLSQEWSKSFEQKGVTKGQVWTEELKAQYFVQTLMTCFSHPSVRAFCFWGMGPGNMFMDGNRLIKDDYTRLETYKALCSLIQTKLRTRKTGTIDKTGHFAFRGYYGQYVLTLTNKAGAPVKVKFDLTPDKKNFTFTYDPASGSLKPAEPSK